MIYELSIILSIVYLFVINIVRDKYGKQKEVNELTKKMKKLTDDLVKAHKENNKNKIKELEEKQKQYVIELNKAAMANLLPSLMILVVFFGFMYVLNYFDEYKKDDFKVNLVKNGDYYTGSFFVDKVGTWKASLETEKKGDLLFIYKKYEALPRKDVPKGSAWLEPNESNRSTNVTIFSKYPGYAIVDNGTRLTVKLPFVIPIFNTDTIYETYWWFIFLVFILNILKGIGNYILKKVKT